MHVQSEGIRLRQQSFLRKLFYTIGTSDVRIPRYVSGRALRGLGKQVLQVCEFMLVVQILSNDSSILARSVAHDIQHGILPS
ncbi:MAG: hypothetical protein CL912_14925 [Deltaproteobacteria bacterium]|nr:hypothetical protein [Deltaproteobacteria bacterium]